MFIFQCRLAGHGGESVSTEVSSHSLPKHITDSLSTRASRQSRCSIKTVSSTSRLDSRKSLVKSFLQANDFLHVNEGKRSWGHTCSLTHSIPNVIFTTSTCNCSIVNGQRQWGKDFKAKTLGYLQPIKDLKMEIGTDPRLSFACRCLPEESNGHQGRPIGFICLGLRGFLFHFGRWRAGWAD